MFSGGSNNENIRDSIFVYFFGEVDLFFVCEHNYNYVLQKCFLWMIFVIFVEFI